nr:hypothetical protein CFP56_68358 [Quercus suber]
MVPNRDMSQERGRQSVNVHGIPVETVLNENWRGKSDAQERRRIQNRLNQRAFRQRQRSGEPSRMYKKRSCAQKSSQSQSPSGDTDTGDDSTEEEKSAIASTSSHPMEKSRSNQDALAPFGNDQIAKEPVNTTGAPDELAQLINRNLHAAAISNARLIGLDLNALKNATWCCTPRLSSQQNLSSQLRPLEAQYCVPHDPFIDTIPDARLRFNILRAITRQQFDPVAFSASLRQSGVLEYVNGAWQRGGWVVWGPPEQIESWEISEPFARRWEFLFEGCHDLIAATNRWRSERAEKLFPPSLAAERRTMPLP